MSSSQKIKENEKSVLETFQKEIPSIYYSDKTEKEFQEAVPIAAQIRKGGDRSGCWHLRQQIREEAGIQKSKLAAVHPGYGDVHVYPQRLFVL